MKENRSGAGRKPGYFWSLIEAREEFNGSKAHFPTGLIAGSIAQPLPSWKPRGAVNLRFCLLKQAWGSVHPSVAWGTSRACSSTWYFCSWGWLPRQGRVTTPRETLKVKAEKLAFKFQFLNFFEMKYWIGSIGQWLQINLSFFCWR